MKKNPIATLALLAAIMIPAIPRANAAQPLDGVISDSMCGRKHMLSGKTDVQCTQTCIKQGASYVLVTKEKVYTLAGNPAVLALFAGKHVQIEGNMKGNAITVTVVHEVMANMPAGMPM